MAVAECCIGEPYATRTLGAELFLANPSGAAIEALLYGEDGARAVVSVPPERVAPLLELARVHGLPAGIAGRVTEPDTPLRIVVTGSPEWSAAWRTPALRAASVDAIPRRMRASGGGRDVLEGR